MIKHEQVPRWKKSIHQPQQQINNSALENILSFSELSGIRAWTRVSKSTCNLVYTSQLIWQTLFKKRHWHLPHEIRNKNFQFETKLFPQLKISDEKVDWFNEFKRNSITCAEIRQRLNKADKKKPSKWKTSSDEETIQEWEEENKCFLPNDLQEYCKVLRTHLNNCNVRGVNCVLFFETAFPWS